MAHPHQCCHWIGDVLSASERSWFSKYHSMFSFSSCAVASLNLEAKWSQTERTKSSSRSKVTSVRLPRTSTLFTRLLTLLRVHLLAFTDVLAHSEQCAGWNNAMIASVLCFREPTKPWRRGLSRRLSPGRARGWTYFASDLSSCKALQSYLQKQSQQRGEARQHRWHHRYQRGEEVVMPKPPWSFSFFLKFKRLGKRL